ncbi:MAG: methionine sulfoxide reductase heme-binding subunit [Chloroflexota bacterium]|nr:methionine sulfoxide reductase heme-binding subunit [Chloroflexota bacterium]
MARAAAESPFAPWARLIGVPFGRGKREPLPWLKPGIFWGSLVPLVYIVLRASQGELGANPIAEIENELGLTALIILVASLACSPARRLLGWTWPMRIRRELGLFAFFYVSLHFATYMFLDQFFDFGAILSDIVDRPFITVGFAAFVLMIPLAYTSTNGWIRRLGYARWVRLHQLVYLSGGLAVLHFIWRVKIDISQPLAYAIVVGLLLGARLILWARKRPATRAVK